MSSLTFRPDINGLRAYAVMMVVGYHFMLPGFGSGFSGVDIFFVISGFLMASIIIPRLAEDNFSLRGFYTARLRRIFPALAAMAATMIIFGWFNLGPTDYAQLGKHVASAISFISNFIFRAEEGYFDAPSRQKWLLHTWSLSVEAQFYALFPLLLLSLRRSPRAAQLYVLWSIAAISLALCIFFSPIQNAFSFYLLPTRAWELLAGSLLYLHGPFPRIIAHQRLLTWLGMAIIISGACLFDKAAIWPSYFAVWPVAGAALLLATEHHRGLLIANPLAQRLGLWSYSIYLWHWPIALCFDYFEIHRPLFGIALSIFVGAASFYGVERPCRRFGETRDPRNSWTIALAALLLIAALGIIVWQSGGLTARLPEAIQKVDAERRNGLKFKIRCGFEDDGTLTPCIIGNPDDIGFVLWGDSHAGAIVNALQEATGRGILYYTHSCATLFDTELNGKEKRNRCRQFNELVMERVNALPPSIPVIIANRYAMDLRGENESAQTVYGIHYYSEPLEGDPATLYKAHLQESLCRISEKRRTYVILPQPEIGVDVPRRMARLMLNGSESFDVTLPLSEYRARNADTIPAIENAAHHCRNLRLLDPIPYLCPDGKNCLASKDGLPLYIDDDHLSERGNRLLLPLFKPLK